MRAKHWILRIAGCCLIFAGCARGFYWYYWLAPLKFHYSVAVIDYRPHRVWLETKKQIHRTGLDHDSTISVGRYGGKEWMEWMMTKIEPGQNLDGAFDSHLHSALASMTNQELGPKADAWLAWWETNRNKTQMDWIRDGFTREGIELQQPMTTNNIIAMLKLVVSSTNNFANAKVTVRSRSGLRYNALRWMRDAGFKPQDFSLASAPPTERDAVIAGLISYAVWFGQHQHDPGVLPIQGQKPDDWLYDGPVAGFERPPLKWFLNLTPIALIFIGIVLLWFAGKPKVIPVDARP